MNIGARLKEIRAAERLTQVELAESSGVPQGTISRIESGSYKEIPPPEILNPLADALHVPTSELLHAAGYSVTEDAPTYDPETQTIARAVRDWTPAQKKLLWSYIEAVSAALDAAED